LALERDFAQTAGRLEVHKLAIRVIGRSFTVEDRGDGGDLIKAFGAWAPGRGGEREW
jgi:hypothetical protein